MAKCSTVLLEACENYPKQSYRNRCRILSANGPQDLRVPTVHDGATLITDIRVDYSTPWVRQSEYAIDSAYYSSAFFEYYRDELFSIMDSKPRTLWELNLEIIRFFIRKIGLSAAVVPTQRYDRDAEQDYRDLIHPKKEAVLPAKPYYQVFSGKFGFTPHLSVMDLLFNEGPESICLLV